MPNLAEKEAPANVYSVVHQALYWGMLLSTILFALGVLSALRHPLVISLGAVVNRPWGATLQGLIQLDPASLMRVATLLLILTPVARVVLACVAFARDRDGRFVLVTGTVLAVIVFTVILGRLGLH